MTFEECVLECAKNDELVQQFHRLTKTMPPPTCHRKELTAKQRTYAARWSAFVYECVWTRLPLFVLEAEEKGGTS